MSKKYYLDKSCPTCEQGRLFVMEDITNNRLYLHCEECECAWLNPEEIIVSKSFLAINPNFETQIPTEEKIDKFGWTQYNLKSTLK